MKYLALVTLSCLILSSCTKPNYYHQSINEIPTNGPNYNLDIRFAGQHRPMNPYFEIMEIQIVEQGKLNRKQMKRRLEREAIREGLDGIIDVEAYAFVKEKANLIKILINMIGPDELGTTSPVHHIEIFGTGFMYLDGMDFVRNHPEYEHYYLVDRKSNVPTPLFHLEYRLTGQPFTVYPEADSNLEIYKKYVKYYCDYHLLKERNDWTYVMKGDQLKKRIRMKSNGDIDKKIIPKYNERHQLVGIKIDYVNNKIKVKEYVQYVYNKQGRIKSKNVWIHDGTTVYEEYEYAEERLKKRKILIRQPGLEPLYLVTMITHYHPDYLQDHYYNDIAGGKDARSQ